MYLCICMYICIYIYMYIYIERERDVNICSRLHTHYLTTLLYCNTLRYEITTKNICTSPLYYTTLLLYLNVACTPRPCLLALNFKTKIKFSNVSALIHLLTRKKKANFKEAFENLPCASKDFFFRKRFFVSEDFFGIQVFF